MSSSRKLGCPPAIASLIALTIAASVTGCSFPAAAPAISETIPSTDAHDSTSSDTPIVPEPLPHSATPTQQPPDQEQTDVYRANQTVIGGSPQQKLAQVFVVSRSGYITHIALPLNCQPGAWLVIRIVAATGGVPGDEILASQVVSGSDLTSYGSRTSTEFSYIAFEGPPAVSEGETYAFTLEAIAGDCGLHWGPPGDSYSGGSAFFEVEDNPPGWTQLVDPIQDLAFKIYVADSTTVE